MHLKEIALTFGVIMATAFVAVPAIADRVVLKTESFTVTEQDFENYLLERKITEEQAKKMLAREGAVKNLFENLYIIRAFASKAESNAQIDKDQIDWMVQNYRERLLMDRQLELEIEADLASVDWDAVAKEEYLANKEKYKVQEQVNAAHILIGFGDRTEEEAKIRAEEILARLQQGDDFAELAREYSDDAVSAAKGGELGFFTRGRMVKPFEDAAFALQKPDEVSGLVKTQFGYHIIRLNERKAESQLAFEKAKSQIMPIVKKRTEQQIRSEKVAAVKSGAVDLGLQVNTELLEEIEARYMPDPIPTQ